MRRLIVLLAGIFIVAGIVPTLQAAPPTQLQTASPVVVLIEFNPWLPAVGATSPLFVLYDNGQVIYRRPEGYVSTLLDADELVNLMNQFAIDTSFFALNDHYDAVSKTDQPSSTLYVWQDGERKVVSIYGDLHVDPEARQNTPQAFIQLYDQVATFEADDAMPWLPDFIEVLLVPADGDEAVNWPEHWPGLETDRTVIRGAGQYSVYIDAAEFTLLQSLVARGGIVRIGEQNFHFSWRFPFPAEERWLSPSAEIATPNAVLQGALLWGEPVFSTPGWSLTASTGSTLATVTWNRAEAPAVAFYQGDVAFDTYSVETVDTMVDDAWLEAVMSPYDSWEVLTRCSLGNYVVVHLSADAEGGPFVARYWAWSESHQFNVFFLAISESLGAELEQKAADLFGTAASCERG